MISSIGRVEYILNHNDIADMPIFQNELQIGLLVLH